jgi:putative flavoprotein involved in K+ transport
MTHQTFEHHFDTVVVGGGQAGLAIGYFLAQQERDFVILDAVSRVGDVWRSRWDSLRAPRYVRENGRLGIQLINANPKRNTEQGGR